MSAAELQTGWGLKGEPLIMAASHPLQAGLFRPTSDSWGALLKYMLAHSSQATPRVHPNLHGEGETCRSGRNALGDCDGQFLALRMEQVPVPEQTDPSYRQPDGRLETT